MNFPYESPKFGQLQLVRGMNEPEKNKVYLVVNNESGQRYVLRCMTGSPEVYEQLMSVQDIHVPKVYEVRPQGTEFFVLEEYIPGDNLAFLLSGGNLSQEECRPIMAGLCDGLTVLHQHGIVHRDVKPENIIIRGDVPVLVDFDASRFHKTTRDNDTRVLGTTGYVAPEQYGISQTDARADIYAMGVLLNIMMTGEHPSVTLAPGGAGRIVRKCTMVNPGQRFQSAEQLKSRLHTMSWPSWGRLGFGIGAVAAVLVILAVVLWPRTETTEPQQVPELPQSVVEEPETEEMLQSVADSVPAETLFETNPMVELDQLVQETGEAMGMVREEIMGYYRQIPQMGEARIQDFTFIVTEEQNTFYYVYPDIWYNGKAFLGINVYKGERNAPVGPTSENVLEHMTIGEPVATGMPGYSCVPIVFDEGYTGEGNLHIEAHYEEDNYIGGNIFPIDLTTAQGKYEDWEEQLQRQNQGNLTLEEVQAEAQEQEESQEDQSASLEDEGWMGYFDAYPTDESERLQEPFYVTEENRTLWLVFTETWFQETFSGLEIYEGAAPPEPTSPELLEHITLGQVEESSIEGCLCVPITVDEEYEGAGNLHINLSYEHGLVVGGNVYVIQE